MKVDKPARDELQIAENMAGMLARCISLARKFKSDRVSLDIDHAEELCQLLHDSIKTAKQLKQQAAKVQS